MPDDGSMSAVCTVSDLPVSLSSLRLSVLAARLIFLLARLSTFACFPASIIGACISALDKGLGACATSLNVWSIGKKELDG